MPAAHADTRSLAAASALGWGDDGTGGAVVEVAGATVVEVVEVVP